MRESDIVHDAGSYWVGKDRGAYTVYATGLTHSKPDSSYALTPDGLSIAIAYCGYRAKREAMADASGGIKRMHLR